MDTFKRTFWSLHGKRVEAERPSKRYRKGTTLRFGDGGRKGGKWGGKRMIEAYTSS